MNEAVETQHPPIFAADGSRRRLLVRGAAIAVGALLAGWLVALALGAFGGFESLPGLPAEAPRDHQATAPESNSAAAAEARRVAPTGTEADSAPAPVPSPRHPAAAQPSVVRPAAPSPRPAPSTRGKSGSRAQGQSQGQGGGTTKPAGKPIGSPGNGPGGSGAPDSSTSAAHDRRACSTRGPSQRERPAAGQAHRAPARPLGSAGAVHGDPCAPVARRGTGRAHHRRERHAASGARG